MYQIDYFKQYESYFWQWEEQFTVVAIPNGSTIAYRAYIDNSIRQLAANGLPRFGSLLLAIIATSPNAVESLDDVLKKILQHTENSESLQNAFLFLKELHKLPDILKESKKRNTLFQFLFQDTHNRLSLQKSEGIISFLDYANWDFFESSVEISHQDIYNDIRPFELLYSRFSSAQLILKGLIGLPAWENEVEILENNPKELKEFSQQDLSTNENTWKVGTLLPFLWSALNIPLHSSELGTQPLGGIADITNKGNFDKLLISEFANDDLVFFSRLANNEALFYQRETVPPKDKKERLFLIDTSLYNWGTPKLILLAAAIAIAKHPKTTLTSKFVLLGSSYEYLNITTLEDIIEAKEKLSLSLNVAKTIQDFFSKEPIKGKEIFFLTEPSLLKQNEVLKVINDFQEKLNYIVTADDKGRLDIYKKQQKNKKHIQQIQIPLDDIWGRTAPERNRVSKEYYNGTFPILINTSRRYNYYFSNSTKTIYAITRNSQLLKQTKPFDINEKNHYVYHGWDLVNAELPQKGDYFFGENNVGEDVLLIYNVEKNDGYIFNITTQASFNFFIDKLQGRYTCVFENKVFKIFSERQNWEIDPEQGVAKPMSSVTYLSEIQEINDKKYHLENHIPYIYSDSSILQNLTGVSINAQKELVFGGKHTLKLFPNGFIKFVGGPVVAKNAIAENIGINIYQFADGSTVELNKVGIFILKSSDQSIPYIFIPSELGTTVGVATFENFAGEDYYFKIGDKIDSHDFFNQYINTFIETICNHPSYGN